jgi:hypothetical protein
MNVLGWNGVQAFESQLDWRSVVIFVLRLVHAQHHCRRAGYILKMPVPSFRGGLIDIRWN